jgi:hypothetical protein
MSQSCCSAVGTKSVSVAWRASRDWSSSLIRYVVSGTLVRATPSIEPMLFGRTLAGRSQSLPALRNLGEKPA